MKCLWFTPLLLFAMAGALLAQETLITPQTLVDVGVLHQWLHSGDPRLIAWAADFARRTHDAKIIAEMPTLLEHWTIPSSYTTDEPQASQLRAAIAVLDTLIQENAKVPIPTIDAVAEFCPRQAIILISRLPLSESRRTLGDWALGGTGGGWGGRTLARVAAMMLAKDPKRTLGVWNQNLVGFVASVVAASEEELQIRIKSTNTKDDFVGSGACGDSLGTKVAPGWPQVYTYDLVENDPQESAAVVVDLDGDRIASRRFDLSGGWGSCNGVQGLDPTTRHRLIAYWLGIKVKDMIWQPVEHYTIVWTDKPAYQQQLGEIIEAQREKLHATVEALRQKEFLPEAETEWVAPRLIVTVKCEIRPCPLI